ncbi:KTSC domain-containing protein [Mesorhizobium sp. WSM4898]|uniref:KTSC domain-containing protein n=1 Tax=Mesorhizobium sp. WSM4898 TaxID=3038544 RepID=UPI0024151873|nr:KTSC domain-containing protein [Mesorhizobium sp. WSM4898]MDG4906249.1 KTSC domain-containing protein [Mesorhizobium sp. WSM4898]
MRRNPLTAPGITHWPTGRSSCLPPPSGTSITTRRRRSFRYGLSRAATANDYEQVEPETHAAFKAARSKGRCFNEFVRDRYSFHLVAQGPQH